MKYFYTTCLASVCIFFTSSILACFSCDLTSKHLDNVQLNGELLFAPYKHQAWYILHNTSKQNVLLNPLIGSPGASAGWSTEIEPNLWSLLAYNQEHIKFECRVKKGSSYEKVNCKKFIAVYKPDMKAINENSKGSYWVAENHSLKKLIKAAKKRGVVPVKLNRGC